MRIVYASEPIGYCDETSLRSQFWQSASFIANCIATHLDIFGNEVAVCSDRVECKNRRQKSCDDVRFPIIYVVANKPSCFDWSDRHSANPDNRFPLCNLRGMTCKSMQFFASFKCPTFHPKFMDQYEWWFRGYI